MSDLQRRIPLFPLPCVLLPWGRMWLRIFEQRYMRMVCECLEKNTEFGLILNRAAIEESSTPTGRVSLMRFGVTVHIVDWYPIEEERMAILIKGEQRFGLLESDWGDGNLHWGQIQIQPPEVSNVRTDYEDCVQLLRRVMRHPLLRQLRLKPDFSDLQQVSFLLSQFLPMPEIARYRMLTIDTTGKRLRAVRKRIKELENLQQPNTE